MAEHRITITTGYRSPAGNLASSFRASCSCGWVWGVRRRTRALAEQDGDDHVLYVASIEDVTPQ